MYYQQPIVVIVGRINVGKSTLFNRLIEKPKAITSPIEGTTRDRNYGQISWRGQKITLVDTGGLDYFLKNKSTTNQLEQLIQEQVKFALEEAKLVLFLVDGQTGPLPQDRKLSKFLKKFKKPIILVTNKIDNSKIREEFLKTRWEGLNLGSPQPVSAQNGIGTGDLLDLIMTKISFDSLVVEDEPFTAVPYRIAGTGEAEGNKLDYFTVAIMGKPNVGKSSLLNSLLGKKRVIISHLPHTTREPQDISINYKNQKILLIDTAGLKKKTRIKDKLIQAGVKKTLDLIPQTDLIFLMTETTEPLSSLDSQLAGLILEEKISFLVVVNKRDLWLEEADKKEKKYKNYFYQHFPYLSWAPIIFTSALTGRNIKKTLDLILEIKKSREKFIEDKILEKLLKKIIKKQRPLGKVATLKSQLKRPKSPFIYRLRQTAINPPTFTLTLGQGHSLASGYQRFIENQIRKKFGFLGTPIKIKIAN